MMVAEASLRQWELEHEGRPKPANEYRRLHHHARADYDREWRQVFWALAKRARVPKMPTGVMVTVVQTCRRGTPLPDTGAAGPTAKAAIDGLVDAGIIPDDGPDWVRALVFVAPCHADRDRLVLLIEEAEE